MKFDGHLDIAVGMSAGSKIWKNKKMLWSDFLKRLSEATVTNETFKEFIAATKAEQHKIKDVGGYVGGYLRKGRRSVSSVVHRQLLTLDIDFAHINLWDDFCMLFDSAAILHATHKHSEASPRFRLLMPLSREVSPDEYVAIARKVAEIIGIELFDNTTFDTNRLMFWASVPKDVEYYFEYQDGKWLDADDVLAMYADWTDTSLWATSDAKLAEIHTAAKKQEDPELKKGLIGAFCRTYTIEDAIDKYLSEVYVSAHDGRYTFTGGSTAAGLIVYDGKFAYSHHGTDPTSGKLCNAWDLVRIHLYGHLDHDSKDGAKLKSFAAMEELVMSDKETKKTIASERLAGAKYDFEEAVADMMDQSEPDTDWMSELETDQKGNYLSSANNLNIIFANDPRLKGTFKNNLFDGKNYVFTTLAWRRVDKPEPIKNVDFSGIRNYLESIYGITGTLKIEDALNLELQRQSYHPIQDYLRSLEWDGVERVDTLLIDYFGADDNIYSREAIRKMLAASVARIFKAGTKFDLVLTLVGAQGTGKSTFIKKLGKEWFSDTFMTVHGKEALEQIQGAWLIEMAELSGLKKAEVESIKHFISKQEDIFRPAYGRTAETYLRQCTFWGTTNNKDFLRDPTGNRRFMPIDIHPERVTKSVFDDLDNELDQIWAEAVAIYRAGEKLYLSDEAEAIAREEQMLHSEADERIGIIDKYLNTPLPKGWDSMDIFQRRAHLEGGDDLSPKGSYMRDYVCVAEIWAECLGKDKEDMSRYNTRELNDIMRAHPEWEAAKSTKKFSLYGAQKYYSRKLG